MEKLVQKRNELKDVRDRLAAAFEGKPQLDFTPEERQEIEDMNRAANELAGEVENLVALEEMKAANDREIKGTEDGTEAPPMPEGGTKGDQAPRSMKSLGDQFIESKTYKDFSDGRGPHSEVEFSLGERKAVLMTTAFPTEPQRDRLAGIRGPYLDRLVIADLIPQGQTSGNSIAYIREATAVNNAAAVAEGGAKPESELTFEEVTTPVRKIATVLPVTDEMFADVPAIRAYVEGRMRRFLEDEEQDQILNGNGTPPNLTGILNVAGIQTQAKGADPTPDAFFKAITKIQVTGKLEPNGIVMHPNDWQEVRLLRTADGLYIWGNPSEVGPQRLWGYPVVSTIAMAENTGLVGAFDTAAQMLRRGGVGFAASSEHSDFFTKNQVMLRIEERLALLVFRPSGFCTVTGI